MHYGPYGESISFELSLSRTQSPFEVSVGFDDAVMGTFVRAQHKFNLTNNSHFGNFSDREYFAFDSHLLRKLDLFVFNGDKVISEPSAGSNSTRTVAYLSSGDRMVLADSRQPGPYNRLETDPGIPTYADRLRLDNLQLAPDLRPLEAPTVSNCLHAIDSGKCLFCEHRFVLNSSLDACIECPDADFYDASLDRCFPGQVADTDQTGDVKSLDVVFAAFDPNGLGNDSPYESTVHTYTSGATQPPTSGEVESSSLVDLKSDQVHQIWVRLVFAFDEIESVNNPFIVFSLYSTANNDTYTVRLDFDSIALDLSSKTIQKEIVGVIFGDASLDKFDVLNFTISERKQSNMRVIASPANRLSVNLMSQAEYLSYFEPSSSSVSARVYSVAQALSVFDKVSVYSRVGLLTYEALDYASMSVPRPGFYVYAPALYLYFTRCPGNCAVCESFEKCTECEPGYFLRHAHYFGCSSACLTCQGTRENCTSVPTVNQSDDAVDSQPLSCPAGEFLEASGGCVECASDCAKCSSASACLQCNSFFFLKDGACFPFDNCRHPEYSQSSSRHFLCADCPRKCLFCNQSTFDCFQCKFGYFKAKSGCRQCSPGCSHCVNSLTCLRCKPDFYLYGRACLMKTIYFGQDFGDHSKLENISRLKHKLALTQRAAELRDSALPNCAKQLARPKSTCFQCQTGFYLDSSFECRECALHCARCLNHRLCLKCQRGYLLRFDQVSRKLFCQADQVSARVANPRKAVAQLSVARTRA